MDKKLNWLYFPTDTLQWQFWSCHACCGASQCDRPFRQFGYIWGFSGQIPDTWGENCFWIQWNRGHSLSVWQSLQVFSVEIITGVFFWWFYVRHKANWSVTSWVLPSFCRGTRGFTNAGELRPFGDERLKGESKTGVTLSWTLNCIFGSEMVCNCPNWPTSKGDTFHIAGLR